MTPPRDRPMDRHEVDVRARHARSYLQAAQLVHDLGDDADVDTVTTVVASLAVLSGIAAADAICGRSLGRRSASTSHGDAVALLATVTGGKPLSNDLSRLVTAKTNVHYSSMLITAATAEDLLSYARRLVDGMDLYSL